MARQLLARRVLIMSTIPVMPYSGAILFGHDDLRDALERMRQAADLGDNPLPNLVVVRQRVESAVPPASADAPVSALHDILFELINDHLRNLRQLENISEPENTRKAQLSALADDYSRGNAELEAWSALHYRYVRLDLNLQMQDIARQAHTATRQVRRRLTRGIHRLAEALSRVESAARSENRRLWKQLKLPPMGYGRLFGAEAALADLKQALSAPGPPWLLGIAGAGGLGKTTLAHAASSQMLDEDEGAFEDLAWVSLSAEEPTSYTGLLRHFARRLGYPHLTDELPEDLERALRARLRSTRTLLVVDSADLLEEYPATLSRLAALVEPGKVLLTGRGWPGSETPMQLVTPGPLSREALGGLVRHEAEQRDIAQAKHLSADALDQLYETLGGNPLAAHLVVGQLARLPLDRILENLAGLRTDRGVPLFDTLFARTWESLGREARQAGLALLLIPPQGALWDDLLLVADLPKDALDAAINELTGSALLEALGPAPRYAIHPLTRRFLEQTAKQDAYRPLFEGLLGKALERAAALDEPKSGEERTPPWQVNTWLQLLRWQAETGIATERLGPLIGHVAPEARRSGQWDGWRGVLERAEAYLVGDELARVQLESGVALRWLGDAPGAAHALEAAIAGFGEQGNFPAQAEALVELGALHSASGRKQEAALAFRRAASTAERYAAHDSLRRALNGLAVLALQDEAIEDALALLRRTLDLSPDEPDAQTLGNLGVACLKAGLSEEAVSFQQEALAQYEAEGDLPNAARAHVRLASAYAARDDYEDARRHFEEGLWLMRALGDALGQARTLVNLGAAHRQEGRWDEAIRVWEDALALQRHLGDEVGMAYTWYNLGDVQWAAGDERAARESLAQAAQLAETMQMSSLLDSIHRHPAQ